jgi:hypothetical protein
MNNERTKTQKVIYKLIKETSDGHITWGINSSSVKLEDDGEVIGKAYTTTFKDKIFRVYAYKYEAFDPAYNKLYTTNKVNLELIDYLGEVLWKFPFDNSINDLYQMIRYKVAKIDDLFDSFLDDDD